MRISIATRMVASLKYLILLLLLTAYELPAFACSMDAWTSVTGTPLALGSFTDPVGKIYEQNCGLTVDATSVPAYVTTTTPDNESVVVVRFYVLADSSDPSNPFDITSGDVTLLKARDGGKTQFEVRLRSTGIVNHLVLFYRDNGTLVAHPETFPIQDVWQAVEVSWSAGSGDGSFGLKLDDIELFVKNDLSNGSEVVNEADFGVVNAASATGELVVDAFMLRRAGSGGLLTVNQMKNISTRADVRTLHEIVIGGFVITGDTNKCVVVRGRGPSVAVPEGVVRLPDPTLVLKSGPDTIASNNDWMDSPEADIIESLGRQPPDPKDAAIYACLPPGPYTALLRGVGGVTGVGIIEVIIADVGTPYLRNISSRTPVDEIHLQAFGGFVIQGDQSRQVLIRARGPSLIPDLPDGVTALADPRVRLVSEEGQIESNDNWGDAANAGDIAATGKAPPDPLESAILITLDPGPYTAIVRGGTGPGVGIVEVLDMSGGSIEAQ